MAQFPLFDGLLLLFQRRHDLMAGAVGDEIPILAVIGVQRRVGGGAPWARGRAGRQARNHIAL